MATRTRGGASSPALIMWLSPLSRPSMHCGVQRSRRTRAFLNLDSDRECNSSVRSFSHNQESRRARRECSASTAYPPMPPRQSSRRVVSSRTRITPQRGRRRGEPEMAAAEEEGEGEEGRRRSQRRRRRQHRRYPPPPPPPPPPWVSALKALTALGLIGEEEVEAAVVPMQSCSVVC
jgi:hypothetical protein